jgi:hypothetical protein
MSSSFGFPTGLRSRFDGVRSNLNTPKGTGGVFLIGIPTLLFILLSPGFLVQIPPSKEADGVTKNLLVNDRTSKLSTFIHAIVFAIVLKMTFKSFSKELSMLCGSA